LASKLTVKINKTKHNARVVTGLVVLLPYMTHYKKDEIIFPHPLKPERGIDYYPTSCFTISLSIISQNNTYVVKIATHNKQNFTNKNNKLNIFFF